MRRGGEEEEVRRGGNKGKRWRGRRGGEEETRGGEKDSASINMLSKHLDKHLDLCRNKQLQEERRVNSCLMSRKHVNVSR